MREDARKQEEDKEAVLSVYERIELQDEREEEKEMGYTLFAGRPT